MHIHILGVAGTFMAGIALIARQLGFTVTGSDRNIYPPMSTLLENNGIEFSNYSKHNIPQQTDMVVVGNAMSRGNEAVEHILNERIPFISGPQWLKEHVLTDRKVIAIAGTHGKTTTTSMVLHILKESGIDCGFLIGGIPGNETVSASIGSEKIFVIEADEYDTAFFDKRSKFLHYCPDIVLLNNLEFDHADIFDNLESIIRQFHHLVRIIPGNGHLIYNDDDKNLGTVVDRGCWTKTTKLSSQDSDRQAWRLITTETDHSQFIISQTNEEIPIKWALFGKHNALNALGAACIATQLGISGNQIKSALETFTLPKRRLQRLSCQSNIIIYEDFAHHPTAIRLTLEALTTRHPDRRILLALEPRSNTMSSGVHNGELSLIPELCNHTFVLTHSKLMWEPLDVFRNNIPSRVTIYSEPSALITDIIKSLKKTDVLVLMSNGDFQGIPAIIPEEIDKCTLLRSHSQQN